MSIDKLIKAGGPAFPLPDPFVMAPGNENNMRQIAVGMTLRDYFATNAMQGICAHPDTWGLMLPQIAAHSYEIADAMLKARSA